MPIKTKYYINLYKVLQLFNINIFVKLFYKSLNKNKFIS